MLNKGKKLSFIACLLCLIGCTQVNEYSQEEPLPKKDTIEVAVFEGGYGIQFYEHAKREFEKVYPHTKVELIFSPRVQEIVRPRFIANNPPDVISEWVDKELYPYAAAGVLSTLNPLLDDFIEGEEVRLRDKLDNNAVMSCMPMNDTRIYYLPCSVAYSGMYYNKTLFREKGYEAPVTWTEFFDLGELAKEEGIALYAYPGLYSHYNGMVIFPSIRSHLSAKELDNMSNARQGSWTVDGVRECLEVIESIAKKDLLLKECMAMSHTQVQREWLNDQVLFIPGGTWIEQEMQGAIPAGFEFGFIPTPVFDASVEHPYMQEGYGYTAVPSQGDHVEIGKAFVKFLYKEDMIVQAAKLNGLVMPVKNALDIVGDYIDPSVRTTFQVSEQVYTSTHNWFSIERIATEKILYECIDELVVGNMNVDDVIERMEEKTGQIRHELYGE